MASVISDMLSESEGEHGQNTDDLQSQGMPCIMFICVLFCGIII